MKCAYCNERGDFACNCGTIICDSHMNSHDKCYIFSTEVINEKNESRILSDQLQYWIILLTSKIEEVSQHARCIIQEVEYHSAQKIQKLELILKKYKDIISCNDKKRMKDLYFTTIATDLIEDFDYSLIEKFFDQSFYEEFSDLESYKKMMKNRIDSSIIKKLKTIKNNIPDFIEEKMNNIDKNRFNKTFVDNFESTKTDAIEIDGGFYTGHLNENNERHGQGIFMINRHNFYQGEWRFDKENGKGMKKSEEFVYEGQMKDGKFHGYGVIRYNDGKKYEGYWRFGLRHGKGKVVSIKGKYEGEFRDDLENGFGTEILDNEVYKGNFVDGLRTGYGILTKNDIVIYKGEFYDEKYHGYGKYYFENGAIYAGEFKNNAMDGKGKFKLHDGRHYEGEYKNNKRHGYGIYFWPDTRKYEGYWKNGKQHGKGIFTKMTGEAICGEWKEGTLINNEGE